uniref:ADP-ribosylation factor GTPase-activating protein 3-like n=1 Tax=Phallusia mammillata TaxID=59560 RepID=A0A6F9D7E1_9ASCI|nr:ADP-ribosylation factor GTPase-activating protein 3-like [Phallusia mammillata]
MSLSSDTTIHAVPASSLQSSAPKSTITKRNAKAKKGLGAKKIGGLGAQKVTKIDFEKLEKNAEEADKVQHRISVSSSHSDEKSNNETSGQSLRLAYKDLDAKEKQDNVKLSKMDKQKKEQASRLGMGMGKTEDVSHSLDMVTISQENPKKSSRRGRYQDQNDIFYDSYSSSRTRRSKWDESDSDEDNNDFSSFTKHDFSYTSKKSSKVDKEPETITITPIGNDRHMGSGMFSSTATTTEPKNNRQRKPGPTKTTESSFDSNKFAGATSISSDMVFGSGHAKQQEQEQRLRSFEGRSAISSDDYYGASSSHRQQGSTHMPDVVDIKDGVREGVRSVAGKLSVMASGIANTIQDRYG